MKIDSDKIIQYGVGAFGGGFLGLFYFLLLCAALDLVGYVLRLEWRILNSLEDMPFLLGFVASVGAYHVAYKAGIEEGANRQMAVEREHREFLKRMQDK